MPGSFQAGLRVGRRLAELAALAFVLLATLHPVGTAPGTGWVVCLWCGPAGTAEALQNLLLFMPLGVVLGWRGTSLRVGIAAGAALSLAIETAQLWIPGRSSSVGDVLFNTLGTGVGLWLAITAPRYLVLPPARAARWSLGAALVAAAALMATGVLLHPAQLPTHPATPWRLRLPTRAESGRVLSVTLDHRALQPGPLAPDVPHRWTAQRRLLVRLVPGVPRVAYAPALTFEDAQGLPWLSLGVGRDVVLWTRTRGTTLRLDEPDLRWAGLLRQLPPRDTVTLTLEDDGPRRCAAVGTRRQCTAYPLGIGWALLLYPDSAPRWLRDGLGAAWLGGLFFPMGLWVRRRPASAAAIAVGIAALAGVPWGWHLLPLQLHEGAGMLMGLAAGRATAVAAVRGVLTPP